VSGRAGPHRTTAALGVCGLVAALVACRTTPSHPERADADRRGGTSPSTEADRPSTEADRPSTGAAVATAPVAAAASVAATAAAAAAATASGTVIAPTDLEPRAIDLHVDTPYQVSTKGRALELPDGQASLRAVVNGRYAGLVYPLYIADSLHDGHPTIADADALFETVDAILAKNAAVLHPAERGPTPEGKIAVWVAIEGAGAFADDVAQLDRFIDRGVVLVGLVHSHDSALATSATGKDRAHGLSDVGKQAAERIYDRGALVDVSHMSDRSFDDVAAIAERRGLPIVATHSSARALADHPRNLTDPQLARIAKSGGIAGVNFHGGYLRQRGKPTMADAVAHTLHMVKVAGVEHVALGSDFDGATPPSDLADASRLPAFAKALEQAGLARADVHRIFRANAERILAGIDARRRLARAKVAPR
jgi:membrane dipeptidase